MTRLFLLPGARRDDPAVAAWFSVDDTPLRRLARNWFDRMCACGPDVSQILHDGHPTACVGDAALSYVNAFTAHVNVGFFQGAVLDDPVALLQGAGKFMRHVKLRPDTHVDADALEALIVAAYRDVRARLPGQ